MTPTSAPLDAPGDPAGGVLVIGYGNTLRSDDGVGWVAAALLADDPRLAGDLSRAGVEVRAVHQLTPELALDFSRASLVILIDAAVDDPPGAISVQALTPDEDSGPDGAAADGISPGGKPGAPVCEGRGRTVPAGGGRGRAPGASRGTGATSHHVGPAELLALARALYGASPRAFVVRVGVADIEVGETLSPAVAAALPAIGDVVVELIAAHRQSWDTRTPR